MSSLNDGFRVFSNGNNDGSSRIFFFRDFPVLTMDRILERAHAKLKIPSSLFFSSFLCSITIIIIELSSHWICLIFIHRCAWELGLFSPLFGSWKFHAIAEHPKTRTEKSETISIVEVLGLNGIFLSCSTKRLRLLFGALECRVGCQREDNKMHKDNREKNE